MTYNCACQFDIIMDIFYKQNNLYVNPYINSFNKIPYVQYGYAEYKELCYCILANHFV